MIISPYFKKMRFISYPLPYASFLLDIKRCFHFCCRSLIYLNLIVEPPYSPISVGSNPNFATIPTPDPFSPLQGKNYSILTCFSMSFQLFKPALQTSSSKNSTQK